jgi:hypothetical protein
MSEGLRRFISEDGTQIMLDANSGKYYTLVAIDNSSGNYVNQFKHDAAQPRRNLTSGKPPHQLPNKAL